MSGDKRSVSTDALETLGTIIDENQKRDAIHVAVEPVQAGEKLFPGQDVGVIDGKAFSAIPCLGIVDPFLKTPVMLDEWFWLLVYPRQITSLRHVWSHPAFGEILEPERVSDIEYSEKWLREFTSKNDCPSYETVVGAATGKWPTKEDDDFWVRNDGEYWTFGGVDAHCAIPAEFWDRLEVVTGVKFGEGERADYFSCSC